MNFDLGRLESLGRPTLANGKRFAMIATWLAAFAPLLLANPVLRWEMISEAQSKALRFGSDGTIDTFGNRGARSVPWKVIRSIVM